MNDHELDLALRAMGRHRTAVAEAPALRERVATIPLTTRGQRRWLPHFDTGGFAMFSALKLIAAGVIVALFGGFLLVGVLTTPQADEMAPGAVTESPSPLTTDELAFPQQVAAGEDWVSSIVDLEALPDGGFVAVVKEPWSVMWSPDGIAWHDGDPQRRLAPYRTPGMGLKSGPSGERVVTVARDTVAVLDRADPGIWLGDPRTGEWRHVALDANDTSGKPDLIEGAANDSQVLVVGVVPDGEVVNADGEAEPRTRHAVWVVDPATDSVHQVWLPVVGSTWTAPMARWFDGRWLLVTDDEGSEYVRAFESVDGVGWTEVSFIDAIDSPQSMTVGPSSIIATFCYGGGDGFWYSTDGLEWHEATSRFLGHQSVWVDGVGFVITDNPYMPVSLDGSEYRTLGTNPVGLDDRYIGSGTAASSAGKLLMSDPGQGGLWLLSPEQ